MGAINDCTMKINIRQKNAVTAKQASELKRLGLSTGQIDNILERKTAQPVQADIPGRVTRNDRNDLRKRLMLLGLSGKVDEFI